MRKYLIITALLGFVPVMESFAVTKTVDQLIAEKQAKMKKLEKCKGTTKGLKIAGISTLGVTAVGIAGNIAEAVILDQKKTETANVTAANEKLQKDIEKLEKTQKTKEAENALSKLCQKIDDKATTSGTKICVITKDIEGADENAKNKAKEAFEKIKKQAETVDEFKKCSLGDLNFGADSKKAMANCKVSETNYEIKVTINLNEKAEEEKAEEAEEDEEAKQKAEKEAFKAKVSAETDNTQKLKMVCGKYKTYSTTFKNGAGETAATNKLCLITVNGVSSGQRDAVLTAIGEEFKLAGCDKPGLDSGKTDQYVSKCSMQEDVNNWLYVVFK